MTAMQIAGLIVETLAEVPEGGPSGHIYMALQHAGVDLDTYQTILGALKRAKLVEEKAHWLKYIGPAIAKQ